MELRTYIFILLTSSCSCSIFNNPQVHEEQNEQHHRTIREPNDYKERIVYQEPVFKFHEATQQDLKKFRYAQQQQTDLLNLSQRQSRLARNQQSKANFEERSSSVNSKENSESFISKNVKEEAKQAHSARKIQDSSEVNIQSAMNREDSVSPKIVYIKPNILKQNFGLDSKVAQEILSKSYIGKQKHDLHLDALNDLLGKNPNVQLEGLQKLLNSPEGNNIFPVIQSAKPFKQEQSGEQAQSSEETSSIEHVAQITPNLPLEPKNPQLAVIQAHLDQRAKAQAEEALQRAQQAALSHVEAQHNALALAAAEARKAAFAKIAAQNQAFGHSQIAPQALPLQGQIVAVTPHPQHKLVHPAPITIVQKVPLQLPSPNLINPLALALKQSSNYAPTHSNPLSSQVIRPNHNPLRITPVSLTPKPFQDYAPNHYHQAAALIQQHKSQHVAQHPSHNQQAQHQHTVSQIIQSKPYEEAVQRHQENTKKIVKKQPVVDNAEDEAHQYASKYAFGYRIKDGKMGNDFGHEEQRSGKEAKGRYHVLLPDGRLQKVDYYADDSGFHAKVTYENISP